MEVECNRALFVLHAEGRVHTSDLRHVSSAGEHILTASRDNTAMVISASATDPIAPGLTLLGHATFVNFALYLPSSPLLDGEPCVVTGSNDAHVALWNPLTATLEAVLDGHAQGVCCGAVLSPGGNIVTGDWGGVCVVFDAATGAAQLCYDKHSNAVRAVAQLPGTNSVVTASGDKTVHHWDATDGATLGVYAGHKDVVQAVCAISATRFASGSNDATIIIWDTAAGTAPLFVLAAHDSLVYSLHYSATSGLLFSASEDRTVKIWRGAGAQDPAPTIVQNINHPCVVWSVCTTAGGDVITGGADGALRVWTSDRACSASAERIAAHEAAVAAQVIDVKIAASAGLDPASLPGSAELLQQRGAQEGARQFARSENGAVEAFVCSAGRWEKVGTVVDGPEERAYTGEALPREKKYHNGVPYDYLFDVDVSGKMLKLGYNVGQSVFDAAQAFINENSRIVSQDEKEQIQTFILRNIDPADAALLTGGRSAAQAEVPNSDSDAPVFSAFAREAAAMRAAGVGQTQSWTDALRNMETAGDAAGDIAFSEYAREGVLLREQERQRQQQQQQQQPVAAGESGKDRITAWDSFKLFNAFNAAGATRKITELTNDSSAGAIVARVQSAAADGPDASLLRDVFALHDRLPRGSRFPAMDLFAQLLCCAAASPRRWAPLLARADAPVAPFVEQRAGEIGEAPNAEAMLTARAAAHLFAALDIAGAEENEEAGMTEEQVALLLRVMTRVTQSLMRTASGNVQAAATAVLRNAALLFARRPELFGPTGTREGVVAVVRIVAQWFIFESGASPCTHDLLATVLTLLQAPGTAAVAAETSRTLLIHTMRTMSQGSVPNIREAARIILHACENGEAM